MMQPVTWALALAMVIATDGAWAQRAPYGPLVVEMTDRDDGQTVGAPVGSELAVHLRQQAGTAYNWELRNDDAHIALIEPPQTYDYPHQPGIVGGPQDRIFRIRVTGAGHFPVIFGLRTGTGGGAQVPAKRVVFTIDTKRGS